MRKDMSRVIITRRRRLHGPRRYKHNDFSRRWRHADPTHEPMSRGRGTKWFDDHLSPLRRFLEKRVGRPWNDVWSEICRQADRRSVVGRHLRDHVRSYVRTSETHERWAWWGLFVVDAEGRLQQARDSDRPRPWRCPEPAPIEHLVADGPDHVLVRLGGIWYRFRLAPFRPERAEDTPDGIDLGDLARVVGRKACVLPATKRQLGRRDLRARGLANQPT